MRKKKFSFKLPYAALLAVLAILLLSWFLSDSKHTDQNLAVIERVVDGDTVKLVGGLHVRLIGIDTPELRDSERNLKNARRMGIDPKLYEQYAKEAASFVRDLALHQTVHIEYDPENESIKHRDRYGRLLAYLWLESPYLPGQEPEWTVLRGGPDEPFPLSLNATLIHAGYARASKRFEYSRKKRYLDLEESAKDNGRGFWQGRN